MRYDAVWRKFSLASEKWVHQISDIPATTSRPRIPRGKPTTVDDSLWKIVGIAHEEQASDGTEQHDKYLADAYADTHE